METTTPPLTKPVRVEDLKPGDFIRTCNGDSRFVRQVKPLKHPDYVRICFHHRSNAWERKRSDIVFLEV